jgi:hypothetical protein
MALHQNIGSFSFKDQPDRLLVTSKRNGVPPSRKLTVHMRIAALTYTHGPIQELPSDTTNDFHAPDAVMTLRERWSHDVEWSTRHENPTPDDFTVTARLCAKTTGLSGTPLKARSQ